MRLNSAALLRETKVGVLSALAASMTFGSACTWQDVRYNITGGTLSFVKDYTTGVWEMLLPPADKVFNNDGGED